MESLVSFNCSLALPFWIETIQVGRYLEGQAILGMVRSVPVNKGCARDQDFLASARRSVDAEACDLADVATWLLHHCWLAHNPLGRESFC